MHIKASGGWKNSNFVFDDDAPFYTFLHSQPLPDGEQCLAAGESCKGRNQIDAALNFSCWKNVKSSKMGTEHLRNHFDRIFSL
jgi:hypothetical protein